tara:strand:- start:468 stop:692 length:225 start_codon:yes stop_codon:yes gene_type:complete
MSIESLNRTSNNVKTLNANLDVLKQEKVKLKTRKICINNLNKRLHLAQKKDKFKNTIIICSIFISIGLVGFIVG